MQRTGWTTTITGVAAIATAFTGVGSAAAEEASEPAPDPAVVADRKARAAEPHPADYQSPPEVQPLPDGMEPSAGRRLKDLYYLSAKSTSGGYIELFARDNPAQDNPGILTTTVRIYGNAAAFRHGAGSIRLTSKFTCSGVGVSGLSVGSSGVTVSGGATSSTLTWHTIRSRSTEARQAYSEGGHFRCKASNASPAVTTHRGIAGAAYKSVDTRAEDAYSFVW